jgi:membrane protein implicated in regulation of membrane protease activity
MIRILEIAWLVITLITAVVAAVQLVQDGIQSALWMFIVSAVAFFMYMIRRKQRIRIDEQQQQRQQDEAARYH